MTQIAAIDVKALRDATGAGMMDAKRALVEVDGDFDAATQLLREKGLAKAAGRTDRSNTEGVVGIAVGDGRAALVHIKCETDFSAKSAGFTALVDELAQAVLSEGEGAVEALVQVGTLELGLVEAAQGRALGRQAGVVRIGLGHGVGQGVGLRRPGHREQRAERRREAQGFARHRLCSRRCSLGFRPSRARCGPTRLLPANPSGGKCGGQAKPRVSAGRPAGRGRRDSARFARASGDGPRGAGAPERETPRAGPGRFGVRRVRDGGAAAQNSKAAAFSNPSSTGAAASKARQEETPEAVRVKTSQRP